jgi:hypothetical protein
VSAKCVSIGIRPACGDVCKAGPLEQGSGNGRLAVYVDVLTSVAYPRYGLGRRAFVSFSLANSFEQFLLTTNQRGRVCRLVPKRTRNGDEVVKVSQSKNSVLLHVPQNLSYERMTG